MEANGGSPKILILTHPGDGYHREDYLVREMEEVWRGWGWRVEHREGVAGAEDADILLLHVDLTEIPPIYQALARNYRVVINGAIPDISKKRISLQRVERGDGYDGPVIVKTTRNSGGAPEARHARRGLHLGGLAHRLREQLPWSWRAHLRSYPVFSSPSQVPLAVWLNRDLIVERFLPERQGDFYCLRTWVFLGDRESNSLSFSREPVVKAGNVVRREVVPDVPDELREIRRKLGFDLGKFDYALVEGKVVLYDANRTPTIGTVSTEFHRRIAHLAEGLRAYLPAADGSLSKTTIGQRSPST
jgi:hypothetical protein